jgi:hypothetical protein
MRRQDSDQPHARHSGSHLLPRLRADGAGHAAAHQLVGVSLVDELRLRGAALRMPALIIAGMSASGLMRAAIATLSACGRAGC